jgi:hypothetical protein
MTKLSALMFSMFAFGFSMAALAYTSFAPAPAQAQECFSPSMAEQASAEQHYDMVEFKGLDGTDEGSKALYKHIREMIGAAVNVDPDALKQFDALILVNKQGADTAYSVGFLQGCMVVHGDLPKELFASLKMLWQGS